MYRNLLVHIPTERSPRPAIDGSISLAMICGAQLDAIAVGYESANNMPFVAEGGAAVAAVFELERERAMERAEAALAVFEVEARAAKIGYRSRAMAGRSLKRSTSWVRMRGCANSRLSRSPSRASRCSMISCRRKFCFRPVAQ